MTRHREREPSENGGRPRQTTIEDTDAYELRSTPPKTIDTDLPARRSHQEEMDGMELDADERKTRVCVRRIRRFLWRREEECEVIFHGCGVPPTTRALFIPVQPSRWDHVADGRRCCSSSDKRGIGCGVDWSTRRSQSQSGEVSGSGGEINPPARGPTCVSGESVARRRSGQSLTLLPCWSDSATMPIAIPNV
nr:unnamed protein product [Digitaria exilis]